MRKSSARPQLSAADRLLPADASIDEALRQLPQRPGPVLAPTAAEQMAAQFETGLPEDGQALPALLSALLPALQDGSRINDHEAMFGYVCGPGLPTDPLAHALTARLGQNVTGYSSAPAATCVERVLLRWLCERAGLPDGSEGVLLSGGSLANFTAITTGLHRGVARDAGLHGAARPVVYAAPDVHFSVNRALRLAGLGTDSLRTFPLVPDALRHAVAQDRAAGTRPAVVVGTAGSTGTGRIDPLVDIAAVCQDEDLWFHVDAAYGGAVLLSDELRGALAGIERADSITIDLHKWLYTTFECSALLYRNPDRAREFFYEGADYVQIPIDPPPEQFAFFHLSPETSRRFRALAPYLALRHYGRRVLAANIEHNVACASYLAHQIDDAPQLELACPPSLSIVCFRVAPAQTTEAEQDALTNRVFAALKARGEFYLSPGVVDGRPVLRVCICSHQTNADTMDQLLAAVAVALAPDA